MWTDEKATHSIITAILLAPARVGAAIPPKALTDKEAIKYYGLIADDIMKATEDIYKGREDCRTLHEAIWRDKEGNL